MGPNGKKILDALFLGTAMVLAALVASFYGSKSWGGVIGSLAFNLFAVLLGIKVFQLGWQHSYPNKPRAWIAFSLIISGLMVFMMLLSSAYSNLGPHSREGYVMIKTSLYGSQLIWLLGSPILFVCGSVLLRRWWHLRPSKRVMI